MNAFRGRIVWSSYDAGRDAYRLMASNRGRVTRLPVRPRRQPFDVDLGPDAHGRTVAVYSRCRSGLGAAYPALGMFGDPSYGRGCDIFEYAFANAHERRLRLPGMRATSEYFPTIWGRTIAFARIFQRKKGRAGAEPFLYYATLPSGRARRTASGTRGVYRDELGFWDGGRDPRRARTSAPARLLEPRRAGALHRRHVERDVRWRAPVVLRGAERAL